MCGICGIVDGRKDKLTLRNASVQKMMAHLKHRGPDDFGFHTDDFCALGMRRLAVIDLNRGRQPIYNEDQSLMVFFNGEIYNFQELRRDLELRGHVFQTQSDTEILVHLYETYGDDMVDRLKGMFAFCIYIPHQNKYFLARDRFGEKPLYYSQGKNWFAFSSEIRSLLQYGAIERTYDRDALDYYLRTSLIPEPLTLFKDIKQLPSGHCMTWQRGVAEVRRYFQIKYQTNKDIRTDDEAREYVKPLLIQAIKRQSISDVPFGAFLSGGIDSSSVVSILQKYSEKPIKTFHVKFEDQAYDESLMAKKVAEHCGTDHHQITIPNQQFEERLFWEIIDHVGQPFRDTSAIPTYLISREIRKHVKVALSGDGGDELFGGYELFKWYLKIRGLAKLPNPLLQIGNRGIDYLQNQEWLTSGSLFRKVGRAVSGALLPSEALPIALNEMFTHEDIRALVSEDVKPTKGTDYTLLNTFSDSSQYDSDLRKIMRYRLQHTLPGNMLVKVDRMSMAHSLEVRSPFLDPDLFDATATLPDRFLIRGGTTKFLLREIVRPMLPRELFTQPKMGFNMPLHRYQNQKYGALAKELLFDNNPLPHVFDRQYLQGLYHRGMQESKSHHKRSVFRTSHQLWMTMQFLGWARRFGVNE